MKKIIINIVKYSIFLGLSILLLYFALRNIDFRLLLDNIKTTKYQYVFVAIIFGFIAMYVRAYRWNIMIEPLGFYPPLNNAYHAIAIGYTANYAFPRIGEVTRCGVLNRTDRIPADALLGTVISERVIDVLCLLILTFITILIKLKFFGTFFSEKVFIPIYEKIGRLLNFSYSVWIILIVCFLLSILLVYVFRERIFRIVLVKKVGKIGKGIFNGVKSVLNIKRKMAFIFHTCLLWTLYTLMTYFFLYSLKSTSELSFLDALFIMLAGAYGMAAPVQAGIGAYHAIVALALSIYYISWNDGIAYALISHSAQAIGIIILGGISTMVLFVKNKKAKG